MSDIAISVENLSKSYLLGHNSATAEGYASLRDVIANNARSLARKTRDMFNGKAIVQGDEIEEFWALKDVSFNIKQGERVGIIGRNGAGKSTLLKILSRITEPSSGRVRIRGRVASLLEVGTGFHPELTGRENIFLNGAILGMSRREIQRKFDEIVAFSEVEKFLDTPVKRYSSGMYVRLAFAVAAHLEPEILIVDEVLAVGDAQFQKKCLGKMEDVATNGRTVLFVSHNMSAINALCSRTVMLSGGKVIADGPSQSVVMTYMSENQKTIAVPIADRKDRDGAGALRVTGIDLGIVNGEAGQFWVCGEDVFLDLNYECKEKITLKNIEIAFTLRKIDETPFMYFGTKITHQNLDFVQEKGVSRCTIPKLPIEPGKYFLTVEIKQNGIISDLLKSAMQIVVHDGDYYGTGTYWPYGGYLCNYSWYHKKGMDKNEY